MDGQRGAPEATCPHPHGLWHATIHFDPRLSRARNILDIRHSYGLRRGFGSWYATSIPPVAGPAEQGARTERGGAADLRQRPGVRRVGAGADGCWRRAVRSWYGTLVTITPGGNSSRVFRRNALWLCRSCSHQWPDDVLGDEDGDHVPGARPADCGCTRAPGGSCRGRASRAPRAARRAVRAPSPRAGRRSPPGRRRRSAPRACRAGWPARSRGRGAWARATRETRTTACSAAGRVDPRVGGRRRVRRPPARSAGWTAFITRTAPASR